MNLLRRFFGIAREKLVETAPNDYRARSTLATSPPCHAYIQASGPGIDNASLSNARVIVGDHLLPVFQVDQPRADSCGTPCASNAEFNGSLTPEMDVPRTNRAMEEYNARKVNAR